jgi:AraC-like DNA-binding protein/quercetin dioxygenase-like cupin family protein
MPIPSGCVRARELHVETPAAPVAAEPDFFSRQTRLARRFCLDLNPDPSAPLVVVCAGEEHCESDYAIHRSGFRLYCVEFVAQGTGTVTLRHRTYPLVPGMLFAYGPGVPHDILPDPADLMVKFFVDFAGREAPRLLRRYGPPLGGAVQTRAPNDILALFDDLVRNGLRKTPFTRDITALILRHLLVKIAETAAPPGAPDLTSFGTYRRCKQFMEARWPDIRTVHDVARNCGIDSAYLCRLFRRFDHQTPHRYLVSLRMREAAQRLGHAHATVQALAHALGYADQFHFSRVFKGFYGVSPRFFAQGLHRR